MLENFQLAAIVKEGREFEVLHVPLHQSLQNALAELWEEQYDAFAIDVQEIAFDAGYNPEQHERFTLRGLDLPEWLAEENSATIHTLDAIHADEDRIDSIKGMVAFARNDDEELILFQNFSRSHVIRPGLSLLLRGDTYRAPRNPGLTLDRKLSAVYLREDEKLLFHNFRTVNTFLPLADFYEEATEQEIREVLSHDVLVPEDPDALAVSANQWFRTRFAMLRDSGVLDDYTPRQIKRRSVNYDVDVQISNGSIVFPADRTAAKKLLQFLNEELFRGAITETLYETNSKREAD